MNIECKQCHTAMKKTKKTETNMTAQIFGVVLFLIGLCLLFVFPIGTIIGLFVMIGAARMGYKKTRCGCVRVAGIISNALDVLAHRPQMGI